MSETDGGTAPRGGIDETVSAERLGEIVGLHERQVRKLAERHIIDRDARGRYLVEPAVRAYCAHLREQAAGRAAGGEDGETAVLTQERAMLVRVQREGYELKNAALRGEMLSIADVESAVGAILIAARQKLLGLPTKAAPLCIGVVDLTVLHDLLTQLVHDALSDLAGADLAIAGVSLHPTSDDGPGAPAAAAAAAAAAVDGERMG